MKMKLPEPHTDYIYAVIGEEFGAIACLALACLFTAIIVRVLVRLLDEEDPFLLFASAGLVAQFGLQAVINISVNLNLLPRSEEHTSELQSLMRISYAVFCLKKKKNKNNTHYN